LIRPLWIAGMVGVGVGFSAACVVNLEGAPCVRDTNCPRSQYCDQSQPGHQCVEIEKLTEAQDACQLALESLSQRLSECAAGLPEHWYAQGEVSRVCGTIVAGVAGGRLTFDPSQVRVCRAGILAMACGDLLTRTYGQMIDDCAMFQGPVADGSPCAAHADCATGFCDTTGGCLGTCRPYRTAGEACSGAELCARGNGCQNGTCAPYISSGGCDAGLCNPTTNLCVGQQCVPREGPSASGCEYTGAGYDCRLDLNCTGRLLFDPRSCQVGKNLGEPCIPYTNNCARFTSCQPASDGGTTCQLNPGPGGMCGLQSGDLVLCTNSRCTNVLFNGTCANFVPTGGSCGANEDCGPVARCVNGRCAAEYCP
jgi:hypothetical protein